MAANTSEDFKLCGTQNTENKIYAIYDITTVGIQTFSLPRPLGLGRRRLKFQTNVAPILICYYFLLAERDSGLAKHRSRKILYHYELSNPTGFSLQMVNAQGIRYRSSI